LIATPQTKSSRLAFYSVDDELNSAGWQTDRSTTASASLTDHFHRRIDDPGHQQADVAFRPSLGVQMSMKGTKKRVIDKSRLDGRGSCLERPQSSSFFVEGQRP
jgi:hypothetical protein